MEKFNLAYLIADMIELDIKEFSNDFLVEPFQLDHELSKNGKYMTIKYCEKYDYEDEVAEVLISALINYITAKDLDITSKHGSTLKDTITLDTLCVFLKISECSGCIFIELV